MAVNTSPIFPLTPIVGIASLNMATAVTSRNPITGTTGLTQLVPTSTNGTRIDSIQAKAQGNTSNAYIVGVWINNGTTSYLYDEITVPVTTATNNISSSAVQQGYSTLTLPPTYTLYVSQTIGSNVAAGVAANVTVYAYGGQY